MPRSERAQSARRRRETARRLYLSGECEKNAEIAARLGVKPHTVGKWRKEEDWDGLRRKVDVRAAEMFVEKIASERTTLNVRHYRYWELVLAQVAEVLKTKPSLDVRGIDRLAGILDRAQKGQRLAKGLGLSGETEETIRAQSQAELRGLIDAFVEAVKENVPDEDTREQIRLAIERAVPAPADAGAGEPHDPRAQ